MITISKIYNLKECVVFIPSDNGKYKDYMMTSGSYLISVTKREYFTEKNFTEKLENVIIIKTENDLKMGELKTILGYSEDYRAIRFAIGPPCLAMKIEAYIYRVLSFRKLDSEDKL